jgi:hypothetical protein
MFKKLKAICTLELFDDAIEIIFLLWLLPVLSLKLAKFQGCELCEQAYCTSLLQLE